MGQKRCLLLSTPCLFRTESSVKSTPLPDLQNDDQPQSVDDYTGGLVRQAVVPRATTELKTKTHPSSLSCTTHLRLSLLSSRNSAGLVWLSDPDLHPFRDGPWLLCPF